uniref:Ribosomal eL28/Mak16 domain-containing protein n=1 Tax=Euplotes harpa TaxID=151035 RepID=A0A7S3JMK9_9SPIT|mmetsp:Transcript_9859/g.11071  ORF Transcript_9859/g.11071 Transcript_9859/m.11071 type:complete len:154 (+) Transcript_9859:19-480(+)
MEASSGVASARVPNCVVWNIIKKNNSFLVKRGEDQFTKDPLSASNRHNASESGIANDNSISIHARKEAAKKTHRRVFDLVLARSSEHPATKSSGCVAATRSVKKEVGRLAKVVGSLHGLSDKKKALLLKRVYRLHSGNKLHQKKARAYKIAKN